MYPNPGYLELTNSEMIRTRLERAEQERMIREAILANPAAKRNIWQILREAWGKAIQQDQESYPPISAVPGESTSI
jgi:hypothetical protein